MFNITANTLTEDFVIAYGKPDISAIPKARGDAIIASLLGDKNRILLGKPLSFDLRSLSQNYGTKLTPNFLSLLEKSDLRVIQFSCSFQPAPQCKFVQASIHMSLKCESLLDKPTVIDLFPQSIDMPTSYKRTFTVKPELKFEFSTVSQLVASAVQLENAHEYVLYENEVYASGVGSSSCGWDFNKTKLRNLVGVKEFFVLLQMPKNCRLKININMSAWVRTDIGDIPLSTFFLSGSDMPLINESFVLE